MEGDKVAIIPARELGGIFQGYAFICAYGREVEVVSFDKGVLICLEER